MSCFGGRVSQDLFQNCCNANSLCEFNGDLDCVSSEPIYVQKVFDAARFNLQGMKTVQNQVFTPAVPAGHRVKRVIDIRCKKSFNPCNIDDENNLKLDVDTTISGATFLQNGSGEYLGVIGPDGTYSEKILYADTQECDERCMGTPIFGTQHISISGNVIIELDLLLCDNCNREIVYTVCADVKIAESNQPLVLTNFFEICMPSTIDTAFLPRFTEFSNSACEARLATNNCGRDLSICNDGFITANLIIALCVTCEKKIVVPVQLCVLSTGYASAPTQQNPICTTFPALFPNNIRESDTEENCRCRDNVNEDNNCHDHDHEHNNEGCDDEECCPKPRRPQPRR